jgi:hypothetical protein
MAEESTGSGGADEELPRAAGVLAATDDPVPIDVRQIDDDRVPEGMLCLGTFLDGQLVARCAVPPDAMEFLTRHQMFSAPRQLVLAAREEEPGLRCELYALVPMPRETDLDREGRDAEEPWAASVPSSQYEREVEGSDALGYEDAAPVAAILLGQIVRFQKDRKHPESLPLETVDVLAKIVSGRVVEVVDKVLEDLLGP